MKDAGADKSSEKSAEPQQVTGQTIDVESRREQTKS